MRDLFVYPFLLLFPVCLLISRSLRIGYGPELHLIYNGAYGAMAGNKHPKLFGQAGAVAWGEIWEQCVSPFFLSLLSLLSFDSSSSRAFAEMMPSRTCNAKYSFVCLTCRMGPHVDGVLRGKAVARQDELLFYERLGPRRLPEETYHVSTNLQFLRHKNR